MISNKRGNYAFECDVCKKNKIKFIVRNNIIAVDKLKKSGWLTANGLHVCPDCKEKDDV